MRVNEIRHDLLLYGTDDTFAMQLERYLKAGIAANEAVLVVVDAGKREILRDALGTAAGPISFLDPRELYTRPEAALAALDATVRASSAGDSPGVRIYGEIPIVPTQAEWDRWIAYESIVNRAFANTPSTLMCGYDTRVVPEAVIRDAWKAHRVVLDGAWTGSRQYEQPEDLVRRLTPAFEPLPDLRTLEITGAASPQELLADDVVVAELPPGRGRDLLVAAREILGNAVRHGNGVRALRVGRVGERVVCEVEDAGKGFDDPLAGFLPPRPLSTDAAGLWIARQLTARLELRSAPGGLTVRLWV